MYGPVSDEFLAAIRDSGKRVIAADLYYSDGVVRRNIPVTRGSVTSDNSADIRRSAHVTVVDPQVIGSDTQSNSGRISQFEISPLTIYGTEMVLKWGIVSASGSQELIPLGRFVVWSTELSYDGGDEFEVELYDRAKYLASSGIPKFYDASGQTGRTAIQALVNAGLPLAQTVTFDSGLTDVTLPGGTTYDNTYLEAILDIATAMGAEFYFDLEGNAICAPKPFIDQTTDTTESVFLANCGEDGVQVKLGRFTSRDSVFNGVGVYGVTPDDSTAQPYAEVFDLTPSSPTYYNGPFGKQFKRIDKPELTSNAQCLAAAKAELAASIGAARGTSFEMLPAPHLEPGDIITVGYPDDTEELHIINSIEFGLDDSTFQVTTSGRNG